MHHTNTIAAVIATFAVAALGAGCQHCIDDEDDAREDNDSADEAVSLADGESIDGVAADCDADFFAFDVPDADHILRILFVGRLAAVADPDFGSSGVTHVDLARGDDKIAVTVDEPTGVPGVDPPPPDPNHASAVVIHNDGDEDTQIEIDVPDGAAGVVTIGVIQDGYADNLFPITGDYTLSATAIPVER